MTDDDMKELLDAYGEDADNAMLDQLRKLRSDPGTGFDDTMRCLQRRLAHLRREVKRATNDADAHFKNFMDASAKIPNEARPAPSSITPMPRDQMPPSISVPAPPGMSDGKGGFKKAGT